MSKHKTFYIPEDYVFDTIDECLEKYPEQAVSHLWDMSEVLQAYDSLLKEAKAMAEALESFEGEAKWVMDNDCNFIKVDIAKEALTRFETWKKEQEK